MTQLLDGNDRIAHGVERGLAGGVDGSAFPERLESYRRELHVYCYRMLGSFDDADDLLQESYVRAWQRRDRLDRGSWLRAWLYRIATSACLDALGSSPRHTPIGTSIADLRGLQPYPDLLLDEINSGDAGAVSRDSIELAFITALQILPPRQRAALILRDVLGWSLRETAGLLDTTMVAANSALQRARVAVQPQPPTRRPGPPTTAPSAEEIVQLERFIEAHEHADTAGEWRFVPTAANRQPAVAAYFRAPGGIEHRACKLDVLRVEGGVIVEVATFDAQLFPAFDLPPVTVPRPHRETW
jgi:RNA polymerase sigma-70 factor (ECF subfamily)